MATEVTASIMFGPIERDSDHARPDGPRGRRLFAPSDMLVLTENSRATWVVQRCPNLRRPEACRIIQPASPRHLLAAAVLGYTAQVNPAAVDADERLRAATVRDEGRRRVEVGLIDDDLAEHIHRCCGDHIYGAVTVLPGSTITDNELRTAAAGGMQICLPAGQDYFSSRQALL